MSDCLIAPRAAGTFLLIARVGMAALFLFSGGEKFLDYRGAVGFARAFQVPFAQYGIAVAIMIELGGAIGLIIPQTCRYAAAGLATWMFVLNPWFHRFWAVSPAEWQAMIDNFFHHFVMIGGLMYVVVFGAGDRAR